jgi:hypothetical protein
MIKLNKEKKEIPILEYTVLAAVAIAFLLFIFQMKTGDINLARSVFKGLVSGRVGVEKLIDWENLQGLTIDVGKTYARFPTKREADGYKISFIKNFSIGFSRAGGDYKSFVNWRIYSKDSSQTVVAADYRGHNKTLLLTLAGAGKKKLTSLQWK